MKSTAMQELVKDGQAYLVSFRFGQLALYHNRFYKKNGGSYDKIEDENLIGFLMNEYGGLR